MNFLRSLALQGKKKTWWQLASRCCWNRARPWHASELVSILAGPRTYQHPGNWQPIIIIIIINIIIISFMQGIYTYIPETNYVPREYSVAAILLLLFMVLISLVPVLNLLFVIIIIFSWAHYLNTDSELWVSLILSAKTWNLTFRWPCIVINSYNISNQMH